MMHHSNILAIFLGSLMFFHLSYAQDYCYGNKSIAGYCTPLTYTDTTSKFTSPPTTGNCQDACRGVITDAGDWSVDFATAGSGIHGMLLYPCGFGVTRGKDTPANANFLMANQDIIDLYDESINRFGGKHGGKISAEGTMNCSNYLVNWYIQDLNA
ncbi:hypothetical protein F4777DRAFT_576593 [Nemania sp. FL0916]|nr:hypothetical protein F4777DRAFT_576593 [Nemania sp. FL0916]